MFGIGNSHSSGNPKTVAKAVPYVQDAAAGSAVSLQKVEQEGGVSLKKRTEAVGNALTKKNLGGVRAQVVVVVDHSGSMHGDYSNGKVQDITERFLAFGLQVDMDGTVPVIPFDDEIYSPVDVNLSNYHNVVKDKIWQPNRMGGTKMAPALQEVRKLAEKTDGPIFCAFITDGEPWDSDETTEMVIDLARYPVFIKFLAVRPVNYLEKLDNLDGSKRLVDNVNTKEYADLSSVSDDQFAADMVDEWSDWVAAAKAAGILT